MEPYTSTNSQLLLGDVVALGISQNKQDFVHPIVTDKDKPMSAVILPIAPDTAILGAASEVNVLPEEIDIASAELSRSFFVACRCTEAEIALANRLGRRAGLFSDDDMRQMLD